MIRTQTIDQQYLGENLVYCNLEKPFKENYDNKKDIIGFDFDD